MLAACASGDAENACNAVGSIDLVKEINQEEGPWVIAFRQQSIDAIAGMRVDEPLLHRWVAAVAQFMGRQEDDCGEYLTAEAAASLKALCSLAVEKNLGVFCCFYG